MSRNRNVRKVASYDDYDDYDDYDEEDYDEEDYAPEKGLDKRTQECLDTVHAYTGTDLKTTQQEIVDKIHAFDYDINAVVDWLFQKEDEMRAHAASRASQAKSHAQSVPKKTQPIAVKAPAPAAKAPVATKAAVPATKTPVAAASVAASSAGSSGSGLSLSSSTSGSKPKKLVSQMSKQDREALMREIAEYKGKKTFNLAIVGHVDAGKSTLMGHLLRLLHVVNDREMHRNEHDSKAMGKGSFLYAWVLDTSEDEKERGITIDISKTYFETNTKSIAVLDSPGHRDFIPQMITAATQADSAILVLDSSVGGFESGISENGQTLEHAMIIRSFGVESVIVAVNKLDLSNWSQERFDFIVSQISPALSNAGLAVHFVPCSGMTGENLLKRTDPLLSSWYTGPTLIDLIDSLATPPRQIEAPFRLCISNTFTSKNGLTVEGKIESGVVSLSNDLSVYPSRELCSIRSIMVADEKKNWAVAGDNVVLILKGVEQLNVNIGNFLVDPEFPIPVVRVFEAKVLILSDRFAYHNGLVVQMQYQNVEIPATIKKILRTLNKKTGQVVSRFPSVVKDKALVVVRIATAHTICIDKLSRNKHISRFALRKGGWTIGSGVVTRLAKPPRSSSSSSSLPLSASHDHS